MNISHQSYYLRTNDGYEIDLILEFSKEIGVIEIKLTANPTQEQFSQLNKIADMFD